ncbi:hypothetical protein DPMN_008291 [Dreissena polymorpha]|uniref:Uncharacterized protein n=1 Tax=Dreissena polymorpha TaxID=45954 RepID=A0A9D4RZI0_DREPO|nr:hypothetical protein DPMN_008291 [Dreissena polymorpha]
MEPMKTIEDEAESDKYNESAGEAESDECSGSELDSIPMLQFSVVENEYVVC